MKFTKNKIILIVIFVCIILFVCLCINQNTGLKAFEKEVLSIQLPENVEKISMKSGIGDSGGNGDYSTYRVILVVKTEMSKDELNQEFENRNLTFSSHIANSDTPICYITNCENIEFKSQRDFILTFDELEKVEDFTDYYFIEFIK